MIDIFIITNWAEVYQKQLASLSAVGFTLLFKLSCIGCVLLC